VLCAPFWLEAKIALSVEPEGLIYRIARKPDPWQPPDWALAGPDETFGNRFDDPEAIYRVLYASARRLGCYLERLARFRPDPMLYDELSQIEGADGFRPLGQVPREWMDNRVVGSALHYGSYADAYSDEWIEILGGELGIPELDAAGLEQAAPIDPEDAEFESALEIHGLARQW